MVSWKWSAPARWASRMAPMFEERDTISVGLQYSRPWLEMSLNSCSQIIRLGGTSRGVCSSARLLDSAAAAVTGLNTEPGS